MKIDPHSKRELLSSLDHLRSFIEHLETTRSCGSCMHWADGLTQCKLANAMPPEHVIRNGCKSWVIFDEIPF